MNHSKLTFISLLFFDWELGTKHPNHISLIKNMQFSTICLGYKKMTMRTSQIPKHFPCCRTFHYSLDKRGSQNAGREADYDFLFEVIAFEEFCFEVLGPDLLFFVELEGHRIVLGAPVVVSSED